MKKGKRINEQKGAAAVEFALVLPLLLLIIFGIVEWGIFMFNDHIITDASRAGARRGILQRTPSFSADEIRTAVRDTINNRLVTFKAPDADDLKVNEPPDPPIVSCTSFGEDLEVIVRYDYTFLLLPSLTAGWVSPSKTITARTVMKCE